LLIKRLVLIFGLLCGSAFAQTYVSQSGGTFSGGTACNGQSTQSVATFNASSPAAGTTIEICATSGNPITTPMVLSGNHGTSGSPINIYFDIGAIISAQCGASTGCLDIASQSWVLVDGDPTNSTSCGFVNYANATSCNGTIQNPTNGTGLATQNNSVGIVADACLNCEIRNLNIGPLYVSNPVLAPTFATVNTTGSTVNFISGTNFVTTWGGLPVWINGTEYLVVTATTTQLTVTPAPGTQTSVALTIGDQFNGTTRGIQNASGETTGNFFKVHNNVIHDMQSAVTYVPTGSADTGLQRYNDYTYNINSSQDISNNNNGTLTQALMHDNHFGSTSNWDANGGTGCPNHHNSLHAFSYTQTASGIQYYNNQVDGYWGICPTGELFLEGGSSLIASPLVFNNFFGATYWLGQMSNGIINITVNGGGTLKFFNNTIIGMGSGDSSNCVFLSSSASNAITQENNIVSGCNGQLFASNTPSSAVSVIDYQTYGGSSSSTPWVLNVSGTAAYYNFSGWQAAGYDNCGACTFNSSYTYVAVNSDGTLQSGSPARSAGVNLTSLGITALDSDAHGTARPTGATAWDGGWLQYVSGGTVAMPTLSLSAGTYANARTTTCSSSTSGASCVYTADGTTPTVAGTNCVVTNGNLVPNNYVLPVSQSVTIKAIGCLFGDTASASATAAYTITYSTTIAATNFGLQCGFSNGACKNPSGTPLILWPTSTALPAAVRMLSSNTDWSSMQPNSSGIIYTDLDGYLDALAATALLSGNPSAADEVFISVPCYLATAPTPCPTASQPTHGTNSPPADLTATGSPSFNSFVTAFVNHCSVAGNCVSTYIKYYEMWNEPNLAYSWAGTELQLEQMIAPAAQIIAATVPNAVILTPSFSTSGSCPGARCYTSWATTWLAYENTVGPFSSWVLMHDYLGTTTPESHGQIAAFASAVHGVSGWSNALVANDETNWAGSNNFKCVGYSSADCIGQIVRWQLIQDSNSYAGVWWFSWNGTIGNGPVGYASAYYWAEQYLIGGHFTAAASGTGSPAVWTAPFVEGNGKTALWVWTTSESGTTYTVPSGYTDYRDISGGSTPVTAGNSISISVQPIMLEQGGSISPPVTVNAAITLLANNQRLAGGVTLSGAASVH
jgi:hypothetical protein